MSQPQWLRRFFCKSLCFLIWMLSQASLMVMSPNVRGWQRMGLFGQKNKTLCMEGTNMLFQKKEKRLRFVVT
uniref:Secreted protein n=1 Tax=Arundo donax TaxID=35708 RepID=A0A0A8XVE0_ARUDO